MVGVKVGVGDGAIVGSVVGNALGATVGRARFTTRFLSPYPLHESQVAIGAPLFELYWETTSVHK